MEIAVCYNTKGTCFNRGEFRFKEGDKETTVLLCDNPEKDIIDCNFQKLLICDFIKLYNKVVIV